VNGNLNEKISLVSIGSISLRLEEIRLSDIKMIHSENDIIARIESDLEFDSLYKLIMDREQLKKELLHQRFISILQKDIHRWYSVAEAGRILGGDKTIPPSTLTYYIDNLSEYIIPDDAPSNKYIRLNYLSLIKMKMVLLLKDEFRLNGLRAELGITGNPKHVIPKKDSNLPSVEGYDIIEKVEQLEAVNKLLLGLLVEQGENGQPELKKPLQALLSSDTLLLEDQTKVLKKLEEQTSTIEDLAKENKKLREREEEIQKLLKRVEEQSTSIGKKIEDKEKEQEKAFESENERFNILKETLKARHQAETEWEKQGFFKKLGSNRLEYVNSRIESILNEKGIKERL
jgi:hypothetical protein